MKYYLLFTFKILLIVLITPGNLSCQGKNDWNIYKSKHGFSIMYPGNWYLDSYIETYDSLDKANMQGGNHFCITSYDLYNVSNPGIPISSDDVKIEILIILHEYSNNFPRIPSSEKIISDENILLPDGNARRILFSLSDNLKDDLTLDIFFETSEFLVIFSCYPHDSQYTKLFDEIVKTFTLIY